MWDWKGATKNVSAQWKNKNDGKSKINTSCIDNKNDGKSKINKSCMDFWSTQQKHRLNFSKYRTQTTPMQQHKNQSMNGSISMIITNSIINYLSLTINYACTGNRATYAHPCCYRNASNAGNHWGEVHTTDTHRMQKGDDDRCYCCYCCVRRDLGCCCCVRRDWGCCCVGSAHRGQH